jgi:hypothetical protein
MLVEGVKDKDRPGVVAWLQGGSRLLSILFEGPLSSNPATDSRLSNESSKEKRYIDCLRYVGPSRSCLYLNRG